jgi:hypothetical protein
MTEIKKEKSTYGNKNWKVISICTMEVKASNGIKRKEMQFMRLTVGIIRIIPSMYLILTNETPI